MRESQTATTPTRDEVAPREPATTRPGLRALAILLGGLLYGVSFPLVIEALGEGPVDPSGLSGLLACVAFVPALVFMRGGGPKRGYWLGFFTVWAGATVILYWSVVAMTVFGHIPLPIGLLILLLFSGAVAFLLATPFAVTRVLVRTFGCPQWMAFPLCLGGFCFLLNYGPVGGFPWTAPGYAFSRIPILLQGASLVGVYGLTTFIALCNGVLADLYVARRTGQPLPIRGVVCGVAAAVALLAWGGYRLGAAPTDLPTVRVALLQGNIEQGVKNQAAQHADFILEKYHKLQAAALAEGAELVVWPEAALPAYVMAQWPNLERANVTPKGGVHPPAGVIGAVAAEPYFDESLGRNKYHRYNAGFVVGEGLRVLGRFDKAHLVPFGEYVPWPLNRLLRQLVPGGSTAGADTPPVVVPIGGRDIPLAVTICYEGLFPEISRRFVNQGAALLVNLTNDAWYGVSSAALQHLSMYSLRAVETGRAVARAANTGITAWVDPRGRIHDATPLYQDAYLVVDVPLSAEVTPYAVLGDWVALPALVVSLLGFLWALAGRGFGSRPRARLDWVLGGVGVVAALASAAIYFWPTASTRDEGDANIATAAVIGFLLVGVGALSGRPWGRTAQRWVGGLMCLFCTVGALAGTYWLFGLAGAGGLLAGLAQKRKHAYVRELDPPKAEMSP